MISIYFCVFYAVPHEKARKMILFHTIMSRLKNKHWQNIFNIWQVHKTEKFRYLVNDVILKHRKELMRTVLVTVWESPL